LEQVPIIQQNSTTLGVSWTRKFKESKGKFILAISSNKLKNIFTRYNDNINQDDAYFRNDSHEWETKIRAKTISYIDDWKITWGGNLQYSDYYNETNDLGNNLAYGSKLNFFKYGVYTSASRKFFDNKLSFSAGVRADEDTYSKGSSFIDNLSPRVSKSLTLSKDSKLKWNSSFGIYYKIPTYTSLGFKNASGVFVNKKNKYTKSEHIVTGFDYSLGAASKISVEGFVKKYSQYPISVLDGISLANKGADFEVLGNEEIITNGNGETYGLEFLFQQKLFNKFYGIFSYTYFHSKFSALSGEWLPSVWDSRNLISFVGGYKLARNWEISSRWRFLGETPFVPYDLEESLQSYPNMILDYTQLGSEKLENFNQLDIRVDKKWNKDTFSFSFYFEILNILAQKVPVPKEYGLARDNHGVIINPISLSEVDIDRSTIIPSFGFSVDF
jgi:hypothetical protein